MKFTFGNNGSMSLHEILVALLALEAHGINLAEVSYTVFTKGFTSPRIGTLEVTSADQLPPKPVE